MKENLQSNNHANKLRGKLEENVSLARYTSWKVGGVADVLFQPADLQDLQNYLQGLDASTPITWLGRGTNVLIRDGGIRGVVIMMHNCLNQIQINDNSSIRAEVGVSCAKLARFSAENEQQGGEFLAGIPGTVGGALAMNSGAYGSETWSFITAVETLNHSGEIKMCKPEEFEIAYRSVKGLRKEWFIAATFQFMQGDGQQAKRTIRELLEKRNVAQPVGENSCGSVFRNPENDYAARLIESCNLKGLTIGGAQISYKHANFIINTGEASANDIESLIIQVVETVKQDCDVKLIPEVKIIGEAV
ncbi:MAG: UDP-N-acetylmuramate dehydrogenase [Pseudomonadota bacterium]